MTRVIVLSVVSNSMNTFRPVVDGLLKQTFSDMRVCVIDNASSDGVRDYVKSKLVDATVISNANDVGYVSGLNKATRYAVNAFSGQNLDSCYVLYLSPLVSLKPDVVLKMVEVLDDDRDLCSVGAKVLRAFDENVTDEVLCERVECDKFESSGMILDEDYSVVSRGEGEVDDGQYDFARSVFGVDGECAMVRVSSLVDVRHNDEMYFDVNLSDSVVFCDLFWRFSFGGYNCEFVPDAVGFKYSGVFNSFGAKKSDFFRLVNRRVDNCLVLVKNLTVVEGLKFLPKFVMYYWLAFPACFVSLKWFGVLRRRKNGFKNVL